MSHHFVHYVNAIPESKEQQYKNRLKESRIPDNFRGYTFDNYKCALSNEAAYRFACDLIPLTPQLKSFPEDDNSPIWDAWGKRWSKFTLTLIGPTGVGKTHLAIATAFAWLKERELSVRYYQCQDLVNYLQSITMMECREEAEDYLDYLYKFNDCLLIIDDFGTQKDTEYSAAQLDLLFDMRYIHDCPTIVTSNLQLDDFPPRIKSRLSQGNVVKISGEDYRLKKVNV